jgi:hypothetical protein
MPRPCGSIDSFRLVRSASPPGKAVVEIATRRPNDDPGQAFFYRFRLQQGTRVYKTYVTFPLHDALLQQIDERFFGSQWRLGKPPGYSDQERSNPFTTFAEDMDPVESGILELNRYVDFPLSINDE